MSCNENDSDARSGKRNKHPDGYTYRALRHTATLCLSSCSSRADTVRPDRSTSPCTAQECQNTSVDLIECKADSHEKRRGVFKHTLIGIKITVLGFYSLHLREITYHVDCVYRTDAINKHVRVDHSGFNWKRERIGGRKERGRGEIEGRGLRGRER